MKRVIPYGRQDILDADISAVVKTLKSDFLTQGPAVEEFESAISSYIGAKHALAVSNGTAGLHLAYLAAEASKGDAVIVPAITFAATSNAALYCGATPVFADIDPRTGCISPESAERCIKIAKDKGLKPKVLAPVHYAGLPCDMAALVNLAIRNNMIIVEDACHALGAEYRIDSTSRFQRVGSADWTSMAVFSFHPVKHITTGEGGAITTSDPNLAKRLKLLRAHGITKEPSDYVNLDRATESGRANPWYHEMQVLGYNYRMCDIQAALGTSQLSRILEMIARRREIALRYDQAFSRLKHIKPAAPDSENARHGYHLYPIQLDFKGLKTTRAQIIGKLKDLGIAPQVHYIPVPWHPYYESNSNLWCADKIPNAANLYAEQLSIPMFSALTDDEQTYVINAFSKMDG